MKHALRLIIALPLLAACGTSAGTAGHSGSASDSADAGYRVLALVSGPKAGGTPTRQLTWLQDDDSASQFAEQFPGDLQAKLHTAFAAPKVPQGDSLFAAVVAVGCDVPTEASAIGSFDGPQVTTSPVPSPKQNCFAPITTVAIVTGPPPG